MAAIAILRRNHRTKHTARRLAVIRDPRGRPPDNQAALHRRDPFLLRMCVLAQRLPCLETDIIDKLCSHGSSQSSVVVFACTRKTGYQGEEDALLVLWQGLKSKSEAQRGNSVLQTCNRRLLHEGDHVGFVTLIRHAYYSRPHRHTPHTDDVSSAMPHHTHDTVQFHSCTGAS